MERALRRGGGAGGALTQLVQLLATASYSLAPWLAYVLVPSLFWRVPSGVAQLSGVMHWQVTAAVLASTIFTILACHRLLERRKDMAGLDMDPRAPGSWYRDVTKYSRSGLPSPASLSAKRMLALCLCGILALLLQIAFSNVLWFHLHSISSASPTARLVLLRGELSSIRTEFLARRLSPQATKMSLSAMVNQVDRMRFGRNQIQIPRELKEDIIQLVKLLLPPSPPAQPSPSMPKTPAPLPPDGAVVVSKEESKRFQQEMKLLKQQGQGAVVDDMLLA
ncbi:hypothetical protein CYMTET_26651 [Cymbomonas tetramitiformis]|uniref:Uncharacterized protein n=1 Tax=Cymbomonas tetramitiformis TaxID=36881 RepID=A0AAE0FRM5_9CHLO|nr:hypothetical protein CYMTET_26651 [Cymbomonas tetramitiformis]